jgi:hypothetical protein
MTKRERAEQRERAREAAAQVAYPTSGWFVDECAADLDTELEMADA